MSSHVPSPQPDGGGFPLTRWSRVVAAADGSSSAPGRRALSELCEIYWPPLHALARRLGHSPEDAADLTQTFFAHLIARPWLQRADPSLGRFRTYLCGAFRHFLVDQHRRSGAVKRGGRHETLSIDAGNLPISIDHSLSPDEEFDRQWAHTLLRQTLQKLAADWSSRGKQQAFERLRPHLTHHADPNGPSLTEAERAALLRLRAQFRQTLRTEVADTLGTTDPSAIDSELEVFRQALRPPR